MGAFIEFHDYKPENRIYYSAFADDIRDHKLRNDKSFKTFRD